MQQTPIRTGQFFLTGLLIICAIILADQYTKWLVMEAMLRPEGPLHASFADWFTTRKALEFFVNERESFRTIMLTPFLNFVMVWNQGISFGMLDTNAPQMPLILIAVALMISLMMLIWLALTPVRTVALSLGMIIGGALANVIDRIRFSAVMDFIDVHAGGFHWPAFNIADSCIVVGACILMLHTLLTKEKA